MKSFYLSFAVAFTLNSAIAQQTTFTQSMASPSILFPELTGWHGGLQVSANYRNQWPGIIRSNHVYVNMDGYAHKIRSGVGVNIYDESLYGGSTTKRANLNLSPKINFKSGLTLMPAVSFQIVHNHYDWSHFTSKTLGSNGIWVNNPEPMDQTFLTAGAGVGAIYNGFYAIAHVDHLNSPSPIRQPKTNMNTLPRSHAFLLGRNFKVGQFLLSPNISYYRTNEFAFANIAMNMQYKSLYVGAKYELGNRAGFAIGYEAKQRVRMSYSYDVNTSRLSTQTLGSHELALRVWLFKDRAKRQFLENVLLM